MMNNHWRRQRGANYYQGGRTGWRQSSKPPSGNHLPSVPSWEKKFCWEVGRVPWGKLLETKKDIGMGVNKNILEWDDSAAEEALKNAKARYWAKINGFSSEIPLPDPNAHTDEVEWNLSDIDHKLLLDYDREFVVDDMKKGEGVIIFGDEFLKSKGFSAFGWGDEEAKTTDQNGGWDTSVPWEGFKENEGGENGWLGHSGGNQWNIEVKNSDNQKEDSVNNQWGCNKQGNQKDNDWGYCVNNRENGGYVSRYRTTRFYGDGQVHNQWENRNGGRRDVFVHEQSCSPINHHRSTKQEKNWGWGKPASHV